MRTGGKRRGPVSGVREHIKSATLLYGSRVACPTCQACGKVRQPDGHYITCPTCDGIGRVRA